MLDSGCTQHMTGETKIFAYLDGDISGYNDIIFGDNSRGEVKGMGNINVSQDHSLSNMLLVDSQVQFIVNYTTL